MITLLITSIADVKFLGVLASLLFVIVLIKHKNFVRLLFRMRWLFLSILLIYAFATPGELIPLFPLSFAPTYEGLMLGMVQWLRLMVALAALNLLLNTSTRQEIIAGLYLWLSPLKYLGLNVMRFTARLSLTLHYVEAFAEQDRQGLSFASLDRAHDVLPDSAIASVHLQQSEFKLSDKLILLTALVFIVLVMAWDSL